MKDPNPYFRNLEREIRLPKFLNEHDVFRIP